MGINKEDLTGEVFDIKTKFYQNQFQGFKNFHAFLKKEYEFWAKMKNNFPTSRIIIDLNAFYESKVSECKNATNDNYPYSADRFISEICHSFTVDKIFVSSTKEAQFIIEMVEKGLGHEEFEGIFEYLFGNWENRFNLEFKNKNFFIGFMCAYEHDLQNNSKFPSRRKSEGKSLEELRSQWQETTNLLESEFKQLQNDQINWKTNVSKQFDVFRDNKKSEIESLIINAKEKIKENEELYKTVLRMKKPVEYWHQRADDCRKYGERWVTVLVMSCIFTMLGLAYILYNSPDIFSASNTFPLVKGIILTLSIISFGAFLVGTCSKLTFANFHLARDAEEREQLTHVYLALKHEANFSPEHEIIILQSLFSRADTGMLRGDHSPAMPGIGEALEKLKT